MKDRSDIRSLNKYINIALISLSKKYNISLIEIQNARDEKISRIYKIFMHPLDENGEEIREEFTSKRSLVSWLLCQK